MLSNSEGNKLKNGIKPEKMFSIFLTFSELELLCINATTKPMKGLRCEIRMLGELPEEHIEQLHI